MGARRDKQNKQAADIPSPRLAINAQKESRWFAAIVESRSACSDRDMAHNSRKSQQFHGGNQQQNRNRKTKEDGTDAFLRLVSRTTSLSVRLLELTCADLLSQPDKVIAGCINDIGIPFTVTDLLKPNPQQTQMVFEWFAELFMNTTRETVEPAMAAAAEDVSGNFAEIYPPDSRNLMGYFASLRKLMMQVWPILIYEFAPTFIPNEACVLTIFAMRYQCGINDFTFADLTRPTYERVAKIFSYLINFVRFRESQTAAIDEHFSKSETMKSRIETLYSENQEMEQRLEEMKGQRGAVEGQVKEKTKRNDELKTTLRELESNQKQVAENFESAKAEKAKKQALLEEKAEKTLKTRNECEKLRPYVSQSAETLQSNLTELSNNLGRDRSQIGTMEKKIRALQTSIDSFNVVSNDVQGCIKALEDIASELQKEEEEDGRAMRNKDALAERRNTVKEVGQTEKLLQRQLARWQERTEALRKSSQEKGQQAQARMEELQQVQKQLREERAEKQQDMERRRIRIEQTEKKVFGHQPCSRLPRNAV